MAQTLENIGFALFFLSERAGIRTPDNLIKSQVLYHLSYTPLFNLSKIKCPEPESNQRHEDFQSSALPTELSGHTHYKMCKLRGQDLNLRPSGYEPDELPDCSTPRQKNKMGGDGFEPSKHYAADLQSVPFGHSGIHPYLIEQLLVVNGTNRARTYDPLLVRQVLSQLSYDPITTQKRLELSTSAVTGRRSNQLSHWAKHVL